MPRLLVRCPLTHQPAATGLVLDADLFQQAPPAPRLFLCASCGQWHTWKPGEVYLEETLPR